MIDVKIPGLASLRSKLSKLPPEIQEQAAEQVGKFLISERVLGWYPRARRITRKAAYGQTFFSDRQRRYFFWALANGNIKVPYPRTGRLRSAWHMTGRGAERTIVNDAPGAMWVIGNKTQSRHEQRVGWQTTGRRLKENARQINDALGGAIKRAIRNAGVG